jgi:transitional endoplasmic reticulum ATPase
VDFETIIEKTKGYSGADIRAVVNEAGLQALVRFADAPDDAGARKERKLTMADFTEALANIDQM